MSKHIADHAKGGSDGARTREFVKIERDEMPKGASKMKQREPRKTGSGRLREFTRIERGQDV